MFETMTGFLWFFFIGLALIVGGILFEEKLIAWEDKHIFEPIYAKIDKFKKWRERRAKMQRMRRRDHLRQNVQRKVNTL